MGGCYGYSTLRRAVSLVGGWPTKSRLSDLVYAGKRAGSLPTNPAALDPIPTPCVSVLPVCALMELFVINYKGEQCLNPTFTLLNPIRAYLRRL